jgi:hypothetical protein
MVNTKVNIISFIIIIYYINIFVVNKLHYLVYKYFSLG